MAIGTMFWRATHKCWYVKIDGKFKRLSPDQEDAEQLYRVLLVEHGTNEPTVADAVTMYLAWHQKTRAETSYVKKKAQLDTLVKLYGGMKATDIEPQHIHNWVHMAFPNAGPTTVNDRMSTVMGVWRWLATNNKRVKNQIEGMEKPTCEMREFFLTKDQWPRLLAACSKSARPVIEFMLRTGARPQEASRVEISQWHEDHFQIQATKAKGKKRARQILVPSTLIPLIESQIGDRTSGHVFLNSRGKPWCKSSFNCVFRRLKVKLGWPELCAYTMRHSFAADRVASGVHMEVVAKLLGHSTTAMVYKRYGHLDTQHELLRAALG